MEDTSREMTAPTAPIGLGLGQSIAEYPKPRAWFSIDGDHVRFECYGDIPTAEAIIFCEKFLKTIKELANV